LKKLENQGRAAALVPGLILASILGSGALTPVLAQTETAHPAGSAATTPESTAPQPGSAATTPEPTTKEPTAMETVVVTGSNLPVAPDEMAVPVSVLGADLIDRAG